MYGTMPTGGGVPASSLQDAQRGMTPMLTPMHPYARRGTNAVFLRDLPGKLLFIAHPRSKLNAGFFFAEFAEIEPASCATLCQPMAKLADQAP